MNIKPFAVEEWMNAYEDGARYNIAETCVDSVSLDELFALTGERGERRGILLRGLVGFDGVRRDDDLRQRPGVGGHAPDMHRVGHDGHAVLGGAGDGR